MPAASDGAPLICLASLLQLANRGNKFSGSGAMKGLLPEK
jgi:hypothetical protein